MHKKIFFILISFFYLGSCNSAKVTQKVTTKKPNLVFILSDDQVYRSIGLLNQEEKIITPNLDKLIKDSKLFTQMHNTGAFGPAVCVASRAMMNTGLPLWKAQKSINTAPLWAETFRKNGYKTFLAGKWHNGLATAKKSFDYIASSGSKAADLSTISKKEIFKTAGMLRTHWVKEKHSSEIITDASIDFLQNQTQDNKPFFMYVSFFAPHDPRESPKEFRNLYNLKDIQVPPNFMPLHPFEHGGRQIRAEHLVPFPRQKEHIQKHRLHYYAIVSHMDKQIGRLIKELKKRNDYNNTYIIFTSDHGLDIGEHGTVAKQSLYDSSHHVPFFIQGRNIKKGSVNKQDLSLYQLYSTTAELCKVPLPYQTPNYSFARLITNQKDLSAYAPKHQYAAYKNDSRMVKNNRYKLILYPLEKKLQLFDRKNDRWELNNLASDKKYNPTIIKLYQELLILQRQAGDTLKLSPIKTILSSWHRPDFSKDKMSTKDILQWKNSWEKKIHDAHKKHSKKRKKLLQY